MAAITTNDITIIVEGRPYNTLMNALVVDIIGTFRSDYDYEYEDDF